MPTPPILMRCSGSECFICSCESLSTNLTLFFNDWVDLQYFAASTGSMLSELLTRNIMQDLVKNLARFFLTFLTYLERFLEKSYKNILTSSCKIYFSSSCKILKTLSRSCKNTLVRFLNVCSG